MIAFRVIGVIRLIEAFRVSMVFIPAIGHFRGITARQQQPKRKRPPMPKHRRPFVHLDHP
jgi:hypothetical protein